METFTELFGSLFLFIYHCFDRVVIRGFPIFNERGFWMPTNISAC